MMLDWQGGWPNAPAPTSSSSRTARLHTPTADCFLAGITRRTAMERGAPARYRGDRAAHHADELSSFSECFITGTAAEVTAVSEIAQWKFTPRAITHQLMDDYTAEVQPKGKAAAA